MAVHGTSTANAPEPPISPPTLAQGASLVVMLRDRAKWGEGSRKRDGNQKRTAGPLSGLLRRGKNLRTNTASKLGSKPEVGCLYFE